MNYVAVLLNVLFGGKSLKKFCLAFSLLIVILFWVWLYFFCYEPFEHILQKSYNSVVASWFLTARSTSSIAINVLMCLKLRVTSHCHAKFIHARSLNLMMKLKKCKKNLQPVHRVHVVVRGLMDDGADNVA